MGLKGNVGAMRAAVASLETNVRKVVASHLSPAELHQRTIAALQDWRIESAKRHIRPSEPPKQ